MIEAKGLLEGVVTYAPVTDACVEAAKARRSVHLGVELEREQEPRAYLGEEVRRRLLCGDDPVERWRQSPM